MNTEVLTVEELLTRLGELLDTDEFERPLNKSEKQDLFNVNEHLFKLIKGALYGGARYRCPHCDDIIRSLNRHHMCFCKCGKSAVDGGNDYAKLCGTPFPVLVPYPKKD